MRQQFKVLSGRKKRPGQRFQEVTLFDESGAPLALPEKKDVLTRVWSLAPGTLLKADTDLDGAIGSRSLSSNNSFSGKSILYTGNLGGPDVFDAISFASVRDRRAQLWMTIELDHPADTQYNVFQLGLPNVWIFDGGAYYPIILALAGENFPFKRFVYGGPCVIADGSELYTLKNQPGSYAVATSQEAYWGPESLDQDGGYGRWRQLPNRESLPSVIYEDGSADLDASDPSLAIEANTMPDWVAPSMSIYYSPQNENGYRATIPGEEFEVVKFEIVLSVLAPRA